MFIGADGTILGTHAIWWSAMSRKIALKDGVLTGNWPLTSTLAIAGPRHKKKIYRWFTKLPGEEAALWSKLDRKATFGFLTRASNDSESGRFYAALRHGVVDRRKLLLSCGTLDRISRDLCYDIQSDGQCKESCYDDLLDFVRTEWNETGLAFGMGKEEESGRGSFKSFDVPLDVEEIEAMQDKGWPMLIPQGLSFDGTRYEGFCNISGSGKPCCNLPDGRCGESTVLAYSFAGAPNCDYMGGKEFQVAFPSYVIAPGQRVLDLFKRRSPPAGGGGIGFSSGLDIIQKVGGLWIGTPGEMWHSAKFNEKRELVPRDPENVKEPVLELTSHGAPAVFQNSVQSVQNGQEEVLQDCLYCVREIHSVGVPAWDHTSFICRECKTYIYGGEGDMVPWRVRRLVGLGDCGWMPPSCMLWDIIGNTVSPSLREHQRIPLHLVGASYYEIIASLILKVRQGLVPNSGPTYRRARGDVCRFCFSGMLRTTPGCLDGAPDFPEGSYYCPSCVTIKCNGIEYLKCWDTITDTCMWRTFATDGSIPTSLFSWRDNRMHLYVGACECREELIRVYRAPGVTACLSCGRFKAFTTRGEETQIMRGSLTLNSTTWQDEESNEEFWSGLNIR